MLPCWPIRATFGLLVCGCLIGGHIIDLEIAKLFSWIIENKPECMTNYMNYFDGSWSEILSILSWIGIGLVIVLFILYLISLGYRENGDRAQGKQYFYPFMMGLIIYIMVLVGNSLIAIWYVGTYSNNFWFNQKCANAQDMGYVYGLLAGSYILPIIGLCAFAWCYIAISDNS